MKAEEFYRKVHWFPGLRMEGKYDKHAEVFDYHDLIDFATQFSESENKELIETLKNKDREIAGLNIIIENFN